MPFKESIKKEVRRKSDGRCVICHRPFVDIHHIIPQNEKGSDTIDNAVALCSYCHDLFGDSPSKRKQLKELRDSWYEIVNAAKTPKIIEKMRMPKIAKPKKDEKVIAVYHYIYKNEDFKKAATDLMDLTREGVKNYKNKKRVLFLDIEDHRLKDGAFDQDMWELQFNFICQNLFYYYSEINLPIVQIINPYEQLEEEIPEEFIIYDENNMPEELKSHTGCLLKIDK